MKTKYKQLTSSQCGVGIFLEIKGECVVIRTGHGSEATGFNEQSGQAWLQHGTARDLEDLSRKLRKVAWKMRNKAARRSAKECLL